MNSTNHSRWLISLSAIMLLVLAACAPAATPTIDPAIYNQVPKTTMFEPGQCKVTLSAPAPAYTSNTLGGQSSGQIPAGTYEASMMAQYSTSTFYALNGVGTANYINSSNVASTSGNCGSSSSNPAPAATNTIQGVIWQWVSVTNQPTKETTTVPNPENYTITFNADYTLTGKADCNNFAGTYSQANGFSIKLGPSTMAFCGEKSLDQQYLQLLSSVAAGGPDGAGGLALENAGGEKRMLFKNGGPAPIDPAIYNQVPKTTTFAAGQCSVTLSAPAPAYTSNAIGGVPTGQIPAGTYEAGVAAQYSTSLWYGLNNVGAANYINSAAVASTTGNCTVNK
jgi:heat shock protein HslJ